MEKDSNEIVTLVLDNQRFEVNKRKLINKSKYFAVLFSKNFKDHSLSEHKINFEISLTFFEDFIKWINCDERNVVINAIENNVQRLLTLLKLSLLFAVNELTETIIDILQNRNLTPQDALGVWPMAQEFSFNMLRDLSFSVCLDRFTELPINLICELSKENFLQLIKNTNLRIPKTMNVEVDLFTIAQEWMKVNEDTISLDNLKKSGPKVYNSIVSYANSEFHLYIWDGSKFFEFDTIKYPEEPISKTPIKGGEIIARGYNLYLIGVGNGRKIFRYSLITKNWHFETTMPCERTEMIAAFLQNKLLIVGGFGSDRQTLRSIDIYDVHKGTWTKGMDIPVTFPAFDYENDYSGVAFDKHLICSSFCDKEYIYIYNSGTNYWCKVALKYEPTLHLHDLHVPVPIIKQFKSASCYIHTFSPEDEFYLENIVCDNLEYKQKFYEKYAEYLQIKKHYEEYNMYFYFKAHEGRIYDYYVLFCSKNENVEYKLIHLKRGRLPWNTMPIQNLDTFSYSEDFWSNIIPNFMNLAELYDSI